jgi:hypothetical protein
MGKNYLLVLVRYSIESLESGAASLSLLNLKRSQLEEFSRSYSGWE